MSPLISWESCSKGPIQLNLVLYYTGSDFLALSHFTLSSPARCFKQNLLQPPYVYCLCLIQSDICKTVLWAIIINLCLKFKDGADRLTCHTYYCKTCLKILCEVTLNFAFGLFT